MRSLLLTAIISVVLCRWSTPIKVAQFPNVDWRNIKQVYRDPVTSLNHVAIVAYKECIYFAVADNGTVVSNATFEAGPYYNNVALLGAGDGKHLFIMYDFGLDKHFHNLMFSESVDGGYHWSAPIEVIANLKLGDAIYIPQTRHLHIFCIFEDQIIVTINMVTKDLDSPTFSRRVILGEDINMSPNNEMLATYNMLLGKPIINLFFWNFTEGQYRVGQIMSHDNGETWNQSKLFSKGRLVPFKLLSSKRGGSVYLAYRVRIHDNLYLVRSDNYGSTFREETLLTANSTAYCSSLILCEASKSSMLVGLLPQYDKNNKLHTEYKMWNTKNMEPYVMEHPFHMNLSVFYSTGMDSQVDTKKGMRYIAAFAAAYNSSVDRSYLYFAVDSDRLLGEARGS